MTAPLSPRAQAILAAVEREVAVRLSELEQEVAATTTRRFARVARPTAELLLALELGVAGLSRAEVAERLDCEDPEPVLDAVFGNGSAPGARLSRAA